MTRIPSHVKMSKSVVMMLTCLSVASALKPSKPKGSSADKPKRESGPARSKSEDQSGADPAEDVLGHAIQNAKESSGESHAAPASAGAPTFEFTSSTHVSAFSAWRRPTPPGWN